ncbi:hypothetical protein [Stenotrophomonas maltophilia]|uniref:hypothetical protein n=1 Tax=Stenotrophomonas maltophilia TaxID=40324 RepID=UPI000C161057|nr:hypothetical protein [Stenotrophomonas maltophilia]
MKKVGMLVGAMLAVLALVGCKKEAALTQAGDINLAGCEVPAGLTPVQAEAVSCAPAQAELQITAEPSAAAPVESVINEALAREAFIFNQSEEDVEARRFADGDLNGDGVSDRAVLFVLEATNGGNAYATHLAVFVREAGALAYADSLPVSGYGEGVQGFTIQEGTVAIKTLVQGPDDATCCPSVEKNVSYVLHNGKLTEAKPASAAY